MSDNERKVPDYFIVPAGVFAAARQIIGGLPHDQVGPVCTALDECEPVAKEEKLNPEHDAVESSLTEAGKALGNGISAQGKAMIDG